MKITTEILDVLLSRGWTIRDRRSATNRIVFADPNGRESTQSACNSLLGDFPKDVEDWIWDNVPLQPAVERIQE